MNWFEFQDALVDHAAAIIYIDIVHTEFLVNLLCLQCFLIYTQQHYIVDQPYQSPLVLGSKEHCNFGLFICLILCLCVIAIFGVHRFYICCWLQSSVVRFSYQCPKHFTVLAHAAEGYSMCTHEVRLQLRDIINYLGYHLVYVL